MQTGNKLILPEIEKLLASTYTTFMTIEEKSKLIIKEIKSQTGTDPCVTCVMFRNMVKNEYINMHGPEHHVLDGACLLMAFYNAGGKINIDTALEKILFEGLRMPCAMCGLWGICGAITAIVIFYLKTNLLCYIKSADSYILHRFLYILI